MHKRHFSSKNSLQTTFEPGQPPCNISSTRKEAHQKLQMTKLCIPAFLHSCIPAFLHSCIPAFLHSCIPAFLDSCIPAFLHSWIPAFLHSCIPAFLFLHSCIFLSSQPVLAGPVMTRQSGIRASDCLSRRRVRARPPLCRVSTGCPKGPSQPGRLFFAYFLLAKQKTSELPPGNPRPTSQSKEQKSKNSIAGNARPACTNSQTHQQPSKKDAQ